MKKPFLLVVFLLTLMGLASGQELVVKTYVEKTHMSPKTGTAIGFENQYQWEYGAFFQETSLVESFMMSEADKAALPRHYEKEFYGLYFAVPVMLREQFVVKANVRTGVSNGENFVITPSLLADYKLAEHIRVGMGLGSRAFRPTLQGSLSFVF
ncbi:hypothetical protein [Ekhidna sp.]|uniref:hypothetical protein n=1 Tax=Ekhidna sp. TaxID=2608089 RepID=UPI003CCC3672